MHQQHGQHGIMSPDLVPSIEAIIHICISQQQAAHTNVCLMQLADHLQGFLQVTASISGMMYLRPCVCSVTKYRMNTEAMRVLLKTSYSAILLETSQERILPPHGVGP